MQVIQHDREENILSDIIGMRREVNPVFILILMRSVEVKTRRRRRHPDIDPEFPIKRSVNALILLFSCWLIFRIRRRVVGFIVDDDSIGLSINLVYKFLQIFRVLFAEDDPLAVADH